MMKQIEPSRTIGQVQSKAALGGILHTERVLLRPVEAADIDGILGGLSDVDVARMVKGATLPFLRPDAVDWLNGLPLDGVGGWSYVLVDASERVIGLVSFHANKASRSLQYWLNRSYWGQGFMGEALPVLLSAFFREYPNATLRADVYADDVPALQLQQRLGFKLSGCTETYASIRSAMIINIQMELTSDSFLHRERLVQ